MKDVSRDVLTVELSHTVTGRKQKSFYPPQEEED